MIITKSKIINKINSLIYDDSINTDNIENVLLIEEKVGFDNYNKYFTEANSNTFPTVYSYSSSRDDLLFLLKNKFKRIKRLCILILFSEKYIVKKFLDNELFFIDEDIKENENSYSNNVNFIINLIKTFSISHFDFLCCKTFLFDEYKLYYSLLIRETNVRIIGSDNSLLKFKCFTDNKIIDIKKIYFNHLDKIDNNDDVGVKNLDDNIYVTTLDDVISLNKKLKSQLKIFI